MRRLHHRIRWTRLALVGALVGLALTNRPTPAVTIDKPAGLEARYPGGPASVEVGYRTPGSRYVARRLWISHGAWERATEARVVVADLDAIPDELGVVTTAALSHDAMSLDPYPAVLLLEDPASPLDYELSSSPTIARVWFAQPPSTRVNVRGRLLGGTYALDVRLEGRLISEALKVELGAIRAAAIEVELDAPPPQPRVYRVRLEPGQVAFLPGPARGELIALTVE